MIDEKQLVDVLEEKLKGSGYKDRFVGSIGDFPFMGVLSASRVRGMGAKYLCAIVDVPEHIGSIKELESLFSSIRNALIKKYGILVGTYLILLCNNNVNKKVSGSEGNFKDLTGMHLNVMLGTIFVNKETFNFGGEKTWGLFYSGSHFKNMRVALVEWCDSQKNI